ncbi:hypothetical protein BKA83DRAFT_1684014 [Pisolithus microcarpus]|nr:hypothetical protein BKA83DRAFT_1684014 [Pisolithus microcarpus]
MIETHFGVILIFLPSTMQAYPEFVQRLHDVASPGNSHFICSCQPEDTCDKTVKPQSISPAECGAETYGVVKAKPPYRPIIDVRFRNMEIIPGDGGCIVSVEHWRERVRAAHTTTAYET